MTATSGGGSATAGNGHGGVLHGGGGYVGPGGSVFGTSGMPLGGTFPVAGQPVVMAGTGGNAAGSPNNEGGAAPEEPVSDALWGLRFGNTQALQRANAIAVRPNGDFALTGVVFGNVDFGGGLLENDFDQCAFVAAYTAEGASRWASIYGGPGVQEGLALDMGSNGNISVAGRFVGTIDLGGGTLSTDGETGAFLAAFDANGAPIFHRGFGTSGAQVATGVSMSSLLDSAVVGYFGDSIDFGPNQYVSPGSLDAFEAGYSLQGGHLWSQNVGNTDDQRLTSIARAYDDSVYIGGALSGNAKLGACSAQTSNGGSDVWLGWLDAYGNCLRTAHFGDSADQGVVAIAAGKTALSNLVAVVGRFKGKLDIGGNVLTAEGEDAFVALFSTDRANDSFITGWARRINDAGPVLGVSMDAQDNVIVVGQYEGEDPDLELRPSLGKHDAFAIKYDVSGNRVWTKAFGSAGEQTAYGVGTDAQNDIYLAGSFERQIALSSGTLTSAGGDDIFVIKLAP